MFHFNRSGGTRLWTLSLNLLQPQPFIPPFLKRVTTAIGWATHTICKTLNVLFVCCGVALLPSRCSSWFLCHCSSPPVRSLRSTCMLTVLLSFWRASLPTCPRPLPGNRRRMHNRVMYLQIPCPLGVNGCIFIGRHIDSVITHHRAPTAAGSFE